MLDGSVKTPGLDPIFSGPSKDSAWLNARHGAWSRLLPAEVRAYSEPVPGILAVGGGKGGVGKSIFSANLAARLAQMGYKVLLADMDIGCSNLHTHFGINRPAITFADLFTNQLKTFEDIVIPTSTSNLGLVTGGRDDRWIKVFESNSDSFLVPFWQGVLSARQKLGVDLVIFDLGAGLHELTVDLFAAAHLGIVVTLPESTSIENAYVFLKEVLLRIVANTGDEFVNSPDFVELISLLRQVGGEAKGTYVDVLKSFSQVSPNLISEVVKGLRSRTLGLLVNQARSQYEMDLSLSMQQICSRFFGFQTQQLGFLGYDDSAWKSLRNRRLLLNDFPHGLFSGQITRIANESLAQLGYKDRSK
ncbi:AAA family ATPase [Oligoflexaceae bacterium]|nr:AAA family ATPase [Oligoflexaceae bacterium]